MKKFVVLLASIAAISCQEKKNNPEPTATSSETTAVVKDTTNTQIGDTIYLKYKNDKGIFFVESALDSIPSKVYLKFNNETAKNLKAEIIPSTGKGNIRFNQIIFPDNSADGPFGQQLNVALTQKGTYILTVGQSLMADAPLIGKFKVRVSLN